MTTTRPAPDVAGGSENPDHETVAESTMWTSRLRRAWMSKLPPDKLLPDRQPAYVASWIYVFGVLTIVQLKGRNGIVDFHDFFVESYGLVA